MKALTPNSNLCALYGRVSTQEQANRGLSITAQESICREQAERDGFTVIASLKDEGKSGGNMNRAGIQEIKRLVLENRINAVYTLHNDRIARNTMDYLVFRQLLRDRGVSLVSIQQPMLNDDSATGRTMDTMMASFNEMSRLVTSDKVKATLYAKAQEGYFPTMVPHGYKSIENPDKGASRLAKKIAVPDPLTAHAVREAFRLYATGLYSVYDIADFMIEQGVQGRLGAKLAANRVYDLLRNRFYIGEIHWGKIHNVNGKHEALIDKRTFETVQHVLEMSNKKACRRRKYQWQLSGFLWCERHDRRYCAEWHLKKKKAYYHCPNRTGCGKYMEQVFAEDTVAEKFKDLEFSDEFMAMVIEKVQRVFFEKRKGYEGRRQGVINRRTALEQRRKVAENKLMGGVLSDDDFKRMRNEIDASLAQIEDELFDLGDEWDNQVDLAREALLITKNIFKAYKKASFNLKKHYLGFFWDRFEAYDGVILKSVSTPLFEQLLMAEVAYFKKSKPRKSPETKAKRTGILSTSRLRD